MSSIPPNRRGESRMTKRQDDPATGRYRNDFGRVLIWTPLLLGGIFVAAVMSRKRHWRSWLRSAWSRRSSAGISWSMLRRAVRGCTKQAIASIMGPPPTAIVYPHSTASESTHPAFWRADVWYYPINQFDQSALAIRFASGKARSVQVIQIPRQSDRQKL